MNVERASLIASLCLALAGCQATPVALPGHPAAPAPRPAAEAGPGVRLEHVLALPTAFAALKVALYSPSVSTAYNPSVHMRTLPYNPASLRLSYGNPVLRANLGGDVAAGLAVGANGITYVLDATAKNVRRFAPDNSELAAYAAGLTAPTGVAVDAAGKLYVVDNGANQLIRYDLAGASDYTANLTQPWGVAVDGAGTMYATENRNNGVLWKIVPGQAPAQLAVPGACTGVAADAAGNAYAALVGAPVVLGFRFNGAPGASFPTTDVTTQLSADNAGSLYAFAPGTQVMRRFDRMGTPLAGATLTGAVAAAVDPTTGNIVTAGPGGLGLLPATANYQSLDLGFGALRPATDYTGRVYLVGADGALVGTSVATGLTLASGAGNNLAFALTPNGQVAGYGVAGGPTVSKANPTVAVRTGVADALPGVAAVDISISGNAYIAGAKVAHLTGPAFQGFSWNPAADAVAAPCNYLAANLSTNNPAVLTFQAFDDQGQVVATWSTPITVVP